MPTSTLMPLKSRRWTLCKDVVPKFPERVQASRTVVVGAKSETGNVETAIFESVQNQRAGTEEQAESGQRTEDKLSFLKKREMESKEKQLKVVTSLGKRSKGKWARES